MSERISRSNAHSSMRWPRRRELCGPMSRQNHDKQKAGRWSVEIEDGGRAGSIIYREGANEIISDWEFGADDVIAIITTPPDWSTLPWAEQRRKEIMERIAHEVIRQKAPGGVADIGRHSHII